MPSGATLESWACFSPDSAVAIDNRLYRWLRCTGARRPTVTPMVDETRVTSVREVPFDPDPFSFDESLPRRGPVGGAWAPRTAPPAISMDREGHARGGSIRV